MPSTVVPALRYRNAPAAIHFLERAFGFTRQLVIEGPDNTIAHAQLTLGDGMLMLNSVPDEDAFTRELCQPDQVGSRETQCPYLTVPDATATCAAALAAGATIVTPLEEKPYGGKAFSCRDPEGHLWFVGEYDPWAPPA